MFVRILLPAALLLGLSGEALAITQFQTARASCASVRDLLESEGAAILRWRSVRQPNLPRYGRFVSSSRFCERGQGAFAAYVPAADTPSCQVFECRQLEFDDPIIEIPLR